MLALSRRSRYGINVWPAFVDALASVLLVFVFVLLVFVVGYFVLGDTLAGKTRALDELGRQVTALAETLSLERARSADLQSRLDDLATRLQATLAERAGAMARAEAAEGTAARLRGELDESTARIASSEEEVARQKQELASLQADIESLRQLRADLERRAAELAATVQQRDRDLTASESQNALLEARVNLLNQQIAALREQLAQLSASLDLAKVEAKKKDAQIADLGERLNIALARKVDELQRYRSEFFGRLREILGKHPGIRIEGDRFVFQSELLFPTASATLTPEGQRQLAQLAKTLKSTTAQIPDDINWVLRVDGHTDLRPINTVRYPSNWDLSTARALSVVEFLISQGIPPNRLVAAGFGEFHPIDKAVTPEALARNRRIEIKLTQP
jgi:chemotaxis protein MotB